MKSVPTVPGHFQGLQVGLKAVIDHEECYKQLSTSAWLETHCAYLWVPDYVLIKGVWNVFLTGKLTGQGARDG